MVLCPFGGGKTTQPSKLIACLREAVTLLNTPSRRVVFTLPLKVKCMERRQLVLFLTVCCVAALLGGCGNPHDGYRELRITSGLAHFSFEYPDGWKVADRRVDPTYTFLRILGPALNRTAEVKYTVESTSYLVAVEKVGQTFPDTAAAYNHYLEYYETQLDFRLVSQTDVSLSGGIPAKQAELTWSVAQMPRYQGGHGGPPEPTTVLLLVFEHDGLIWDIELSSNQEVYATDEPYIDHMLATLKIAD